MLALEVGSGSSRLKVVCRATAPMKLPQIRNIPLTPLSEQVLSTIPTMLISRLMCGALLRRAVEVSTLMWMWWKNIAVPRLTAIMLILVFRLRYPCTLFSSPWNRPPPRLLVRL